MKFVKKIENAPMSLTGLTLERADSKRKGKGYDLVVDGSPVYLCAKARRLIGLDLQHGESVNIRSITFEFETEPES